MAGLKKRTKEFALRIIKLVESLPKGKVADVIGKQLYKMRDIRGRKLPGCLQGRSQADFIAKMEIVEEKVDETMYWMEY